jgi:hypothetical protein
MHSSDEANSMQAVGNWLKAESMSKESLLSLKAAERGDTNFTHCHESAR